jgi:phosphatidylinositol alpha 1,6-mannosyltransferase
VVVVAESFLPKVDGVSNSVVRVLERLERDGHDAMVVAAAPGPATWGRFPVVRVRSAGLPGYADVRVAIGRRAIARALAEFRPDVAHVASPAVLGAIALRECRRAGVPSVAVFQTDLGGFARGYGVSAAANVVDWYVARVHGLASLTLVPSSSSVAKLAKRGVTNLRLWPRGVDAALFDPARRSSQLREAFGAPERTVVGYVGRLAREKAVERLVPVAHDPRVSLVIVGAGPCEDELRAALPGAHFVGFKSGVELAEVVASLDVFVHTGIHETFCQAVQEALCAGVPVVAPRAGGPVDLVDHGVNGLLWDPRIDGSLESAVRSLVDDPALRARLAAAARESVAHRSWESVTDALLGAYELVMTGSVSA